MFTSPPGIPFFGGDLPDFGRQAPGDVVVLFGGNHTHATLFGDATGCGVRNCFGSPQERELQRIEPVVSDGIAGLRHVTLSVPGQSKPKSAIDVSPFDKGYAADHPIWFSLQP